MKAKYSIRKIALIVIGILLFVQVHAQHATTFRFSETAPEQVLRVMENNTNALFAEINSKYDTGNSQLDLPLSVVTEFARNKVESIWAVSHFYCTRSSMNQRVLKMVSSDAYQIRNIPICFKEGDSDEYKYQHVVLEFDKDGKISDLYCALPENEVADINMVVNGLTNLRNTELIMGFINRYYTAYYNKDLDLIEKVFSEDALFFWGKSVKYKANGSTDSNNPKIEYSIQNKQQYLAKLRRIFQRNSFINIKIDGVEIIQSEQNLNIFGVRLNQYWNAGGYYDEGKLFFAINFTNVEQPVIWVTSWQPFKDANGNPIEYSEEDYFSIGDFSFE